MTGWSTRAAEILGRAGYTDISYLDGGIAAWEKAGFVLFSGVHVPSKAFGEFVEHDSGTPSVSAQELDALMRAGTDMVVLDSPAVRRIFARLDPDRHQCARRRTGAARARHRALARDHHRRQLRRPHPQHHRRAVADQCRRAEQGGGAAQRHHGLASGRAHLRQRQGGARAGTFPRRPRLGQIGGRKRRAQIQGRAHRPRHARTLSRRQHAHDLRLRRARSGRIPRPATCPARSPRPAASWCRRPICTPARSARASCFATTRKHAR